MARTAQAVTGPRAAGWEREALSCPVPRPSGRHCTCAGEQLAPWRPAVTMGLTVGDGAGSPWKPPQSLPPFPPNVALNLPAGGQNILE